MGEEMHLFWKGLFPVLFFFLFFPLLPQLIGVRPPLEVQQSQVQSLHLKSQQPPLSIQAGDVRVEQSPVKKNLGVMMDGS